jgi:hypothetical protein
MTTLVTQPTIEATLFNSLATISGSQVISNKTLKSAKENVTIIATAPPSIVNFEVVTQPIVWYNSTTTGNFIINVVGKTSPATTLNSLLSIGDSITVNLFVKNDAGPYYATSYQIDGVAITPKFQGGNGIVTGGQYGIDLYVLFMIKTANSAWTLFVSQTKFA